MAEAMGQSGEIESAVVMLRELRRLHERLGHRRKSMLVELAFRSEAYGPGHPLVGESAHALGVVEIQRGRPTRARGLLQQAVSIRDEVYPPGDPDTEASLEALRSIE